MNGIQGYAIMKYMAIKPIKYLNNHHQYQNKLIQIMLLYVRLYQELVQLMDPEETRLAQQAFQMMECGNLELRAPIQYGILLVGNTKAGKTTSAQYIANQVLVGYKAGQDQIFYKVQASKYDSAKIGMNERVSETWIPNLIQIQMGNVTKTKVSPNKRKSFIIDCPGYLDSYGCYRIISNRFFHYLVFSKVEKAKFVITFSYADMDKTNTQMLKTFSEFLKGFTNLHEIKQDIFEACSIMVTSVPKNLTKKDIVKRFSETHSAIGGELQDIFLELRKTIVEKERVFIFNKAEVDKVSPKNNLLEEMKKEGEQEGKFWVRKIDQDEADMTHVKISMLDYSQQDPKLFNKQLEYLQKFYENQMLSNIKNFILAVAKFSQDTQKGEEITQFIPFIREISQSITKWRNTQSKCDKLYKSYDEKRIAWRNELFGLQKSEKSELNQYFPTDLPLWLCKLKAFKKIEELSQKSSLMEGERSTKMLKMREGMIKEILNFFIRLGKRKKQKSQALDNLKNQQIFNFAYEVYKDINISNKLYQLVDPHNNSKADKYKEIIKGVEFILVVYPSQVKSVFLKFVSKGVGLIDKFIANYQHIVKVDDTLSANAASEAANFMQSMIEKLAQLQKERVQQNSDSINSDSNNAMMGSVVSESQPLNYRIVREIFNSKKIQFYNISFESGRKLSNPSLSKLKQMEEVRREISKSIASKEDRIVQNNKIVQLMAQVLEKNGYYDIALSLYDSIFDAMKIFQILDIKEDKAKRQGKKPAQRLKILKQYMSMARKYHMKETAIKKGLEAHHYAIDASSKEFMSYINGFLKDVSQDKKPQPDTFSQHIFEDGTQAIIPKNMLDDILKLANEAKINCSPNGKMTPK